MHIADSVLKHHLQHVFWIHGGPCAGKTTTARRLGEKHGFPVYDANAFIQDHQKAAHFHDHPALLRPFIDWEWFFNRPLDDYAQWLSDLNHELAEWAIVDLLKLPSGTPIVVEQDFAHSDLLRRIARPTRVAYLFAEDELIARDLLQRDDHADIRRMIEEHTKDPAASTRNVIAVATLLSHRTQEEAVRDGHFVHVRTAADANEDILPLVEKVFGL